MDVAVAAAVAAAVDVVTSMMCHDHNRLLLQFHITGRCNLRCRHCYRTEGDVERLSYEDVIAVLEQFKQLLTEYNSTCGIRHRGHVNLTGGEPFYREDICRILEYMGQNSDCFTYGILSNGSFIDEKVLTLLQKTKVSFVQLSIDGDRQTHDSLRAPGDYDRFFSTASMLETKGIRTYISFTANRKNYRYLPRVAAQCRKRGITKLWSDRLVPIGNGQDLRELVLTEKDLPRYIRTLKRAQGNCFTRRLYPKTQVTMNRALQFQSSQGRIYSCSAGKSLITVDEFGNIMPCRRMPILCGDVFSSTLSRVYWEHETFRQLRVKGVPPECVRCPYAPACRGGARCQSYARLGSFRKADPACPLLKKYQQE